MTRRDPDNPTPWQQIVEVIGEEAAAQLSRAFGGTELYVPRSPGASHPIAFAIGLDLARKLGAAHGGAHFDVRVLPGQRARIVELAKTKMTKKAIAQQVGCTERHVYAVLAEAGTATDEQQLNLFA